MQYRVIEPNTEGKAMLAMTKTITSEMAEIRALIAQTVAKRNILKNEMEKWYEKNTDVRYERTNELITVDSTLSALDSHFKRLWDYHNTTSRAY
jgi:uncharacterized protein